MNLTYLFKINIRMDKIKVDNDGKYLLTVYSPGTI